MKKYPSYLNISKEEWKRRNKKALKMLNPCVVCPRRCKVNRQERTKEKRGFCGLKSKAVIASFHPHFGEESPLVGSYGSGTIFFAHCNLACQYCQNYDISQLRAGSEVDKKELAVMMIKLQDLGCHNINFVTPSPNVPQILESLPLAIEKGLKIPLVYNTSSYDSLASLKLLAEIVDIYMPDTKYSEEKTALEYSLVPNYPSVMKEAIKEMFQQVGDLQVEKGIARKGILVRHLVLPEGLSGTKEIMKFLASLSKNTFVNIMAQYRPAYKTFNYPPLNRDLKKEEFEAALAIAKKAGLKRVYTQ